ncbi:hypothetical protein PS914_00765 [Pseudomonas fluorescens]|uniref:hypothetical protein n=1 Tax=Pseudomonas fluorescens TaxID=294 RepID=UPI0012415328|nr:hypothetical protein [Pseudomonas fluorescens]VVP68785.1 hypothetical protein PS914_00765 [Pseudomonas fluorescens]
MKTWTGLIALIAVLAGAPIMTKAAPLTTIQAKTLIEQANTLNSQCRGGSGDDPKTTRACAERDVVGSKLGKAGWCYGEGNEAGYLRYWKTCGATRLAEIETIEKTFDVQYAGKFVKAIQDNRDKDLEWFKGKAFELEYAYLLTNCLQGVCYFQAANTDNHGDRTIFAIYQQKGDFVGRWIQGDYVRVIGVDRSGNFRLARLN